MNLQRCWTQDERAADTFGINWVRLRQEDGLNLTEGIINSNCNSGSQLINLLWHMGYRDFALTGYDFGHDKGRKHWFGDHPTPQMNVTPSFSSWAEKIAVLARDITDLGGRIVNCSRKTTITGIPRETIEEWLDKTNYPST